MLGTYVVGGPGTYVDGSGEVVEVVAVFGVDGLGGVVQEQVRTAREALRRGTQSLLVL
jgi:hypothetical protein